MRMGRGSVEEGATVPAMRKIVGAALVAALLVPAAARAVTPQTVFFSGKPALLAMARHNPDHRVVLYVHGAGEEGNSFFTGAEKQGIVNTLYAHGFALASMDAEGTAWGSDTSLADYLTFIRYLRRVGLTNIYVLCQSMGGLDALRLAGRVRIRAWAGIYPLANLSSIDAGSRPAIESTLGDAFARYWQTLSPAPIRFPAGLRVILWSSYGDTVVPRAENTDVIAAAARREGARVRVVTTTGNHGDPSNFEPATLVRFFEHG